MQKSTSQVRTRVLVVEDEPLVALDTQRRLEHLGLDVIGTAKTGAAALTVAARTSIDLVMMDVNLCGDLDGAQTALELRNRFDVPCVFLTAYSDDETIERCRLSSPLGYIVKPYEQRAFSLALTVALQQVELVRERQRACRDRDAANARYANILLHSMDAVVCFDDTLKISVFNRGAEVAFGWKQEEAIGQTVALLIPESLPVRASHSIAASVGAFEISKGDGARRRIVGLHKSGNEFPAEIMVSKDSGTGTPLYTALIRDLSEEERLRGQFIQAQKMEAVGLLAAHVAHDFNNLLLGLRAYMYLLRKEAKPEHQGYLNECDRALNRGAGLTHNLTTLARPDSTEEMTFDVSSAIDETLTFAGQLLPRRIGFDYKGLPAPCFVRMNRGRFDQALLNLMINARDAISGQGTVTVRASLDSTQSLERLRIVISDAGCGMSPSVVAKAFEPFYTTKPPGLGTGLGLPSVRGIVESAGGTIALDSEEGTGTHVSISLPTVHPTHHDILSGKADGSSPLVFASE